MDHAWRPPPVGFVLTGNRKSTMKGNAAQFSHLWLVGLEVADHEK
jgi:hypothetical protein